MNFLADANVFVPMVEALRRIGHDVFDLIDRRKTRIRKES